MSRYRVQVTVDVDTDSDEDAVKLVDGLLVNHFNVCNVDITDSNEIDYDPTPWCSYGHMSSKDCDCGPITRNN